jgi:hypothetical protein
MAAAPSSDCVFYIESLAPRDITWSRVEEGDFILFEGWAADGSARDRIARATQILCDETQDDACIAGGAPPRRDGDFARLRRLRSRGRGCDPGDDEHLLNYIVPEMRALWGGFCSLCLFSPSHPPRR